MNRVTIQPIQDGTTVKALQIQGICHPRPLQKTFKSQKFPVYPIIMNFYLDNPPYNKISLLLQKEFMPEKIEVFGSADSKDWFRIIQFRQQMGQENGKQFIVSKYLKQSHFYHYLRLKFHEPVTTKVNICKQISLNGIELCNITIFNTKYVCNLNKKLQYHPAIFALFEMLQYKATILQKNKSKISEKYLKRLNELENQIYSKSLNSIHPTQEQQVKFQQQFKQLLNQTIYGEEELDQTDPVEIKSKIKNLQQQLANFYVDRLNNLHKNVTDYFQKYWNVQIRDIYLRLLSSPQDEDQTKALVQFWSQVKQLNSIPFNIQQAVLMFINYYLEFISDPIKIGAVKILCIFLKFQEVGLKHEKIYSRILFNLINGLQAPENQEYYKTVYKSIFMLYKKVSNKTFLKELLNRQTSLKHQMKLKKLQILEKLTFAQVDIEHKEPVVQFLLDVLLSKYLTIQQKNKAYNVIAYLAAHYGKQSIMGDFQQLNAMILMSMEQNIDKKLNRIKQTNIYQNAGQLRTACEHCGQQNQNFKDENIYDLHCFKQCKMLTGCDHCNNIIQVPQLFKHYLNQCTQKNKFKNCDNCNDVILIAEEQKHKEKCSKNFTSKCPLCNQKLQNKLQLKQHLLKDGCPNNGR